MICKVGEEGRNQVAWVLRTQCLWVFQVEPEETGLKCTSRNSEGMAGQNYIGVSYYHMQRTKVEQRIFFSFLWLLVWYPDLNTQIHTQTRVCTHPYTEEGGGGRALALDSSGFASLHKQGQKLASTLTFWTLSMSPIHRLTSITDCITPPKILTSQLSLRRPCTMELLYLQKYKG